MTALEIVHVSELIKYRVTRKKPYRGKSEIKEKVIKIETSYILGKLQTFISNILVYDT